IALSKLEFEESKADTKKLIELTKKALQENADLKKRIIRLEKLAKVETSNRRNCRLLRSRKRGGATRRTLLFLRET
ncbi:hypothetical protein ACLI2N_17080, partial [Enterococcus faecalis]